jgi:tetratricopeptide (TPR) repeat protein
MSRVFLAEETRLGRKVVVKVLPPEMGAGVNVERFEREIQLAAKLQHPHVVPLLTAGSHGDLLYYVMPYIEGESLRAKLAREGELPVREAVAILKEVLDALAYAHQQGVVHRDIKPDNVLLSGKHAVVTDFGVAKAVSASTGESSLTSLGVALGTPAYMSPEQAAANPHVDHRADIYAVGALAYEMLCGQPPFAGPNPQAILAAHVTNAPEPATSRRAAVPTALNGLVMRCLEKLPADRWQRADELIPHLDAMVTPSGGMTPTGTQPVSGVALGAIQRQTNPWRVAALFALASVGALAIVYFVVLQLGLPYWVVHGAVALLAIGLPIMLLTGHHERQRAVARTTGVMTATPAGGVRGLFTWRRAILGGGVAFVGLSVVAGTYMAMRLMGIGPAGTLMATGAIGERERLILAQFESRTADLSLGPTVTELFRVGMAQSPVLNLMEPNRLAPILARMERDPNVRIDEQLALEIAVREGLKAIVTGDIVSVGSGFAISAQVVSVDGDVLTAQQTSARSADGIIAAVDELSAKLRERIGESLRTIRRKHPLEQVTTASLDALTLYTQGLTAENAGDDDRAVDLFAAAIAEDSTFAMAWRKLGTVLGNNFEQRDRAVEALTKAYEYRDRLTDRERAYAASLYHMNVTGERERAISAYRTLLETYTNDVVALNNTGVMYFQLRDYRRALEFYKRALAEDSSRVIYYTNVASAYGLVSEVDSARAVLDLATERFPGAPQLEWWRAVVAVFRRDYEATERHLANLGEQQRGNLLWRTQVGQMRAQVATLQGRLTEADRHWRDVLAATEQRGLAGEYAANTLAGAYNRLLLTGDVEGTGRSVQAALNRYPLDSVAPLDRPYELLSWYYALAGDVSRAEATARTFEASGLPRLGRSFERQYHRSLGVTGIAAGDVETGIAELRRGYQGASCLPCELRGMARGFDMAGEPDSALVYWEAYATTPVRWAFLEASGLPTSYRRVGELYEAKGDREKALEYYNRFVELWQDADPELQPIVRDVRQRMARLVGEG